MSTEITKPWFHLELGAANYGVTGHSNGKFPGGHKDQYRTLYATADQLISKQGLRGYVYLNDIKRLDCDYASKILETYLSETYPDADIKVVSLPKNYHEIDLLNDCKVHSLAEDGIGYFDSIHLKNPDRSQLQNDYQAQDKTGWMEKLARTSKTGLTIIHFYSNLVPFPKNASPINKKSSHLLRYDREPIASTIFPEEYIYVHPDGSRTENLSSETYIDTFRFRNTAESFSKEEQAIIDGLKKGLTDKYEASYAFFSNKAKEVEDKVIRSSLSGLFNIFYEEDRDRISIHNLTSYLMFPFHQSFINSSITDLDLENSVGIQKSFEEALSASGLAFENRCLTIEKLLKTFNETQLSRVKDVDVLDFSNPLRYYQVFKKGRLIKDFENIGLGKAFRATFKSEQDFWNSDGTLSEVYLDLLTKTKSVRSAACTIS